MENYINNLIHVTRYNGLNLIKSESDSDHVWGMISIALGNVYELNKAYQENNLPTIDIKTLIYKIVIHDIGECFYGDIPKLFKYKTEKLHDAIEEAEHMLMEEYLNEKLVNDIDDAKDFSLEGRYVRLIDWIQAGVKICAEINLGNQFIKTQLNNVIELLDNELNNDNDEVRKIFIIKYLTLFLDEQKK